MLLNAFGVSHALLQTCPWHDITHLTVLDRKVLSCIGANTQLGLQFNLGHRIGVLDLRFRVDYLRDTLSIQEELHSIAPLVVVVAIERRDSRIFPSRVALLRPAGSDRTPIEPFGILVS